jgi:prevent-host-death family protein
MMEQMEANVHEAKTNFSKLLARVAAGEVVIITKAGKPVAKLVPLDTQNEPRRLGMDVGKVKIAEDFDAPMPADFLQSFDS